MPTNLTIQTIVRDVRGSTGHRYALRDSVGNTMDTLKIIANPAGGYLGVYHRDDEVKLATSVDLLTWTFRVTLDPSATQPTICTLPTGGFLSAVEFNNQVGSGGQLRLRHYANLAALLSGSFNRERTMTRRLSACNEGTPTVISASLTPDIDHSVIDIAFHFQQGCDVDRQARGVLTNFSTWSAAADTVADTDLIAAAAVQGRVVNGNIGDRDTTMFDHIGHTLHEVQYIKSDFGSWRLYLHNWQTGSCDYQPVVTHGGSTAFANPAITTLTSPSGKPAVVCSVFLPSEGAAPGEAGQLAYFREYTVLPTNNFRQSATHLE